MIFEEGGAKAKSRLVAVGVGGVCGTMREASTGPRVVYINKRSFAKSGDTELSLGGFNLRYFAAITLEFGAIHSMESCISQQNVASHTITKLSSILLRFLRRDLRAPYVHRTASSSLDMKYRSHPSKTPYTVYPKPP